MSKGIKRGLQSDDEQGKHQIHASPKTASLPPQPAPIVPHRLDGTRTADDNADVSWKGCGETPSFSAFSYGQSTEYHPESRLTQQAVELRGDGYGGGGATDEATTVVAAPKGHWAAGGGGNYWVGGDREQQVPPATEN